MRCPNRNLSPVLIVLWWTACSTGSTAAHDSGVDATVVEDAAPARDAGHDDSDGGLLPDASFEDAEVVEPDDVGAQLPISYVLADLAGPKIFVSPSGSDSTGDGSEALPYGTLQHAIDQASDGYNIVLRGGTYPIAQRRIVHVNKGVTIIAYPHEIPVFDGAIPAPASLEVEGNLRHFPYQPIPANTGSGLTLYSLPAATFSGDTPTGMAATRGWRCVTGSSTYVKAGTPSACPSGSSPRVINAYYPDQVWVNGARLLQVADKALVVPGTFYVPRDSSTDRDPGPGTLYLHEDDAVHPSQIRVSYSGGTIANLDAQGFNTQGDFLRLNHEGITIEGIRIIGHSPAWDSYAIRLMRDNASLNHVEILSNAAQAVSIQESSNITLNHVSLMDSGWMGLGGAKDDLSLIKVRVANTNAQREFNKGPRAGGVKLSKAHNTRVEDCEFLDNYGYALWFDQSCYGAVVAGTKFINNQGASLFYEISHDLTAVNNLMIAGPETDFNLRLAASSGLKIVNNTIIGGDLAAASVTADGRTKKYDSDGDGIADRYCAEHERRYGLPDDPPFTQVCVNGMNSDLDYDRPGRYGTTNQTYGLNFQPSVDLFVNNILSNNGTEFQSGALRVLGFTHWRFNGVWVDASVMMDTIFHQARTATADDPAVGATVFDGNIYQLGSDVLAVFNAGTQDVNASTGADFVPVDQRPGASFTCYDIATLHTNMANGVYGLTAETCGKAGTLGQWVDADGQPTAALSTIHSEAYPVPVDPVVNQYIPAGTRHYGYLGH